MVSLLISFSTTASDEGSDLRRSKLRLVGVSLGLQLFPSMVFVCKSDKFLSLEIVSSRAVDHPRTAPSPLPLPPSSTAGDLEAYTARNGLVDDIVAAGTTGS